MNTCFILIELSPELIHIISTLEIRWPRVQKCAVWTLLTHTKCIVMCELGTWQRKNPITCSMNFKFGELFIVDSCDMYFSSNDILLVLSLLNALWGYTSSHGYFSFFKYFPLFKCIQDVAIHNWGKYNFDQLKSFHFFITKSLENLKWHYWDHLHYWN